MISAITQDMLRPFAVRDALETTHDVRMESFASTKATHSGNARQWFQARHYLPPFLTLGISPRCFARRITAFSLTCFAR